MTPAKTAEIDQARAVADFQLDAWITGYRREAAAVGETQAIANLSAAILILARSAGPADALIAAVVRLAGRAGPQAAPSLAEVKEHAESDLRAKIARGEPVAGEVLPPDPLRIEVTGRGSELQARVIYRGQAPYYLDLTWTVA